MQIVHRKRADHDSNPGENLWQTYLHHPVQQIGPSIGGRSLCCGCRSPQGRFKENFGSAETQIVNLYLSCQPAELLHGTITTPPSKSSRVGSSGEPRPLEYQRFSLQERRAASASAVPGATWQAPATVVAERVETGSVASYMAGSDARSAGRV